jgi:hypothetical protein
VNRYHVTAFLPWDVFLQRSHKTSSCEPVTFSIFRVFCITSQLYFKPPDKAVILSEALGRSIGNRELHGAESKDPGDAYWRMLLGAFRPRTTPEDKNVTNSERSASQIYRVNSVRWRGAVIR